MEPDLLMTLVQDSLGNDLGLGFSDEDADAGMEADVRPWQWPKDPQQQEW